MTEPKSTLLIVDDEPVIRQHLRQILQNKYNLSFATSGAMALEAAETIKPDLILLDIMMPEMDGYETCAKLKANPAASSIPVIFISILTETDEKINAFKSGAVDYVCKPFQSDEVIARIDTHLKLYNLQRHLENRVEEEVNKRRLEEQMLIQQSKMAAMGEMIGAIAHQWKQPLNTLGLVMQDVADAFNAGELDAGYLKEFTAQGMGLINLMAATVDDFQSFLRPSKQIDIFNVTETFYEVVKLFSNLLKSVAIEVQINTPQTRRIYTTGYRNELKQVILNLINNSRDAIISARRKGVDIDYGVIAVDIEAAAEKVVISISDNGGGIDNKVIDKLFDAYVSTKGEGGMGIGLYMSKAIIEGKMNGKIAASNIEGGAQFTIELPLSTP
ncbi:sensor histidine kinase [Candidatus Magnetominusculus xianensis]|uniref:histidine kinase n=1 Tax=Candidatus Magnetominusculus xianensis TaxID=1748249 RepID=A0ABR5SN57_9BACT|nr:hybrid sensor histidine kinase/response regulator [Candidatus Magnetominusculus xianensis]KWT94363.1 multi-sensor signal transduction histidine kinase [Candidatus Magnetominusculus xianensis]MBF0403987.1 hybrid sensor histidine kinase/response regulator [Nitrospirota bacterium]